MLTDNEKNILDLAEDVIKQGLQSIQERRQKINTFTTADCKILQRLVASLDQTVRIRNMIQWRWATGNLGILESDTQTERYG